MTDAAAELSLLLRSGYRLVAVESFEEDRALRALERASRSAGRTLRTWSVASGLDGSGEGIGSLDACLRSIAASEEPAVFALMDAHELLSDPLTRRLLRDTLGDLGRRRQTLVLVGPVVELPEALDRDTGRVQIPLPTAEDLTGLFSRVSETSEAQPEHLDECVRSALGLTASEAVRVYRKALLQAEAEDDAPSLIAREKRRALRRVPALEFVDGREDLSSVGGLGELKRWLRDRRRAFGEDARRFGLPVPRGLLLLGVQGCGKSLCAKAVAREWSFPLLRLDLAAAFGDRTTSPEITVRQAAAVAESLAPAVLWIDEIEKGFAAVQEDASSSRVFGSFLTWLAEKRSPVFVAATANDVAAIPPELLRRGRFDDLFFVDLPTEAERVEVLAIHLRKQGRDPTQFPLEELAAQAERLSGAELEQVVGAALHTAFARGRELQEGDLAGAIQETVPLYETYEERIKELRNWARTRARPATLDPKMVDLFQVAEARRSAN